VAHQFCSIRGCWEKRHFSEKLRLKVCRLKIEWEILTAVDVWGNVKRSGWFGRREERNGFPSPKSECFI
jgi:hypothetical protein